MGSRPITFLWLWPATDHEPHCRHVPINKIWRRTKSTPRSGWWCSHMVGIDSDCYTRETITIKAESWLFCKQQRTYVNVCSPNRACASCYQQGHVGTNNRLDWHSTASDHLCLYTWAPAILRLTELWFYVTFDTKQVILETFPTSQSLGLVRQKTKPSATKARVHQSKAMYYNTKNQSQV